MPSTVVITAGALIGSELIAEFGPLPPSFLPVGNQRLYTLQLELLRSQFDRIIMSLPAEFELEARDAAMLENAQVTLVRVPLGFSLPASLLHVIAVAEIGTGPLAVLHGDTLVLDVDLTRTDAMSVASTSADYSWAVGELDGDRVIGVQDIQQGQRLTGVVLSGFFHFEDLTLLVLSLAAADGKFSQALDRYVSKRPMAALQGTRWLDFGHLHTFYASRSQITTERAFNNLTVRSRHVVKSSVKRGRIDAEASWYEAVPAPLRLFLPQYLGRQVERELEAYRLEFLHLAPLSDLLTFGALPYTSWLDIFRACSEYLSVASSLDPPLLDLERCMALYLPKTLSRLETFRETTGFPIEESIVFNGQPVPALVEIAKVAMEAVSPVRREDIAVLHGDLCFSNILYDFRSRSIRVIDPRGEDAEGVRTVWGDIRYDRAKLHHSIIGRYDLIIGGYADVKEVGPLDFDFCIHNTASLLEAQRAYRDVLLPPDLHSRKAIEGITVLLFLAMLPLHADQKKRQEAMLCNAIHLWLNLVAMEE